MGRRSKEEPRTARLNIRLTEAEKAAVDDRALADNRDTSEWARDAILRALEAIVESPSVSRPGLDPIETLDEYLVRQVYDLLGRAASSTAAQLILRAAADLARQIDELPLDEEGTKTTARGRRGRRKSS